jgi:hypothetical protein
MVYRRALHPELLDLQGRRVYRHGDYEVECWIAPSGHVVRFQALGDILTEAVIEKGDHLPEFGLVHALPCLGEKDYELPKENGVGYVTTIQTESLTDNLYRSTFREMQAFVEESDPLAYEWKDESGAANISILDVQKLKSELHVQSYHLIGATGLVLRTQSIFEVI